jgi:membrane-bound lytic murein transglycosylase B
MSCRPHLWRPLSFSRRHLIRAILAGAAALAALAVLTFLRGVQAPTPDDAVPRAFRVWRAALVDEALAEGFDRRLVESTLAGLAPLGRVLEADRTQAEVAERLDDYLAARVTPELIGMGRELMQRHRLLLTRIERRFGVPGRFLVAIWGAETGYGRYTGDVPVLRALATLAWHPRRAAYFRGELFDALRMVERGYIDPQAMLGSWAGAMGQPQFMPSSYLEYAVDFDGDDRRDIWTSEADTLASIANYLRAFGWRPGVTWGREVEISAAARRRTETAAPLRTEGCHAIRSLSERRALRNWGALGVRRLDESRVPRAAIEASLLTLDDRAFLVYRNYEAILGYNCAHRYALGVAALADGIR